jgi:uncharacterized protein
MVRDRDLAGRDRDRDPAGRPRNARARDALGRPLSRDTGEGATQAQAVIQRSPAETVAEAENLLQAGRPFHAHEVFEDAWKQGPAAERDLWQGLAQIAVGLTHAHRGNARGAVSLLRRGAERTGHYQGSTYGIDLAVVRARATALADTIDNDGLSAVPEKDLIAGLR